MTLTAEQAAAEGLPPGPPPSAPVLSAKDAEAEGLPSSGPAHDSAPSEPAEPSLSAKILKFLVEPPPTSDKYRAFVKSASPPDAITNDSPDWKAGIGVAARSMPGLVPDLGGDDRIARFEQEHPGLALALGFAGPGGMKKVGGVAQAAEGSGGILGKLRAWSEGLGQQVEDKAAKAADATAASAKGTLGAVTREGSSTLRDLSREEALPASEIAANRAALETPKAQALATDLAGGYREKLPNSLDHIESARALADQTAQEAARARTPENVKAYASDVLKNRTREQLKRYALPIAGATYGALSGDDAGDRVTRAGAFGAYGLAGRAISPTFNAVVRNNILAPERLYRIAPHLVSVAERVAQLPASTLGRFAAPIQNALKRGPNALAAIHYKLSEDPEYQAITRKAAEQHSENDGAAQ